MYINDQMGHVHQIRPAQPATSLLTSMGFGADPPPATPPATPPAPSGPSVIDRLVGGLLGILRPTPATPAPTTPVPGVPVLPPSGGISTGTALALAGGTVAAVILLTRRK